jgi:hypothetical protein
MWPPTRRSAQPQPGRRGELELAVGVDDLAVLIVSKGADSIASKLVELMLAREAQTVQLLKDVQVDVSAILHGPFNTGVAYLREAARAGQVPAREADSLRLARQEFMRALGQEREALTRGEAATYAAAVWVALGERETAGPYAQQAAAEISHGIVTAASGHNKLTIGQMLLVSVTDWFKPPNDARKFTQVCKVLPARLNEANRFAAALGVDPTSLRDIEVTKHHFGQRKGNNRFNLYARPIPFGRGQEQIASSSR